MVFISLNGFYYNLDTLMKVEAVDEGYLVEWPGTDEAIVVPKDSPQAALITGLIKLTSGGPKLSVDTAKPIIDALIGRMDKKAVRSLLPELLKRHLNIAVRL